MFTGDLHLTFIDGTNWLTSAPFSYESPKYKWRFFIPQGFATDGASVPRPLWSLFSVWGKHGRAAVLHDFMYKNSSPGGIERKICDLIFFEAMRLDGVNLVKACVILMAVRLFGASSYRSRVPIKKKQTFEKINK